MVNFRLAKPKFGQVWAEEGIMLDFWNHSLQQMPTGRQKKTGQTHE